MGATTQCRAMQTPFPSEPLQSRGSQRVVGYLGRWSLPALPLSILYMMSAQWPVVTFLCSWRSMVVTVHLYQSNGQLTTTPRLQVGKTGPMHFVHGRLQAAVGAWDENKKCSEGSQDLRITLNHHPLESKVYFKST